MKGNRPEPIDFPFFSFIFGFWCIRFVLWNSISLARIRHFYFLCGWLDSYLLKAKRMFKKRNKHASEIVFAFAQNLIKIRSVCVCVDGARLWMVYVVIENREIRMRIQTATITTTTKIHLKIVCEPKKKWNKML